MGVHEFSLGIKSGSIRAIGAYAFHRLLGRALIKEWIFWKWSGGMACHLFCSLLQLASWLSYLRYLCSCIVGGSSKNKKSLFFSYPQLLAFADRMDHRRSGRPTRIFLPYLLNLCEMNVSA